MLKQPPRISDALTANWRAAVAAWKAADRQFVMTKAFQPLRVSNESSIVRWRHFFADNHPMRLGKCLIMFHTGRFGHAWRPGPRGTTWQMPDRRGGVDDPMEAHASVYKRLGLPPLDPPQQGTLI